MTRWIGLLLFAAINGISSTATAATHYLIVSGLGGQSEYADSFVQSADSLNDSAVRTNGSDSAVTLLSGDAATREAVMMAIDVIAETAGPADSVSIFLIGHGSYDGEQYKFNLPGPDITGEKLAELFSRIPANSQLVVNASSASGAILEDWAADGRTVVTATRSGAERNATRFGAFWAEALSSAEADLNKNGTITAEEAFNFASRKVADSYAEDDALATEHPQLVGEGATRFNAARLVARSDATPRQRELVAELERLEVEIEALRAQSDSIESDVYLNQLQALLVELALVQRQIDEAGTN